MNPLGRPMRAASPEAAGALSAPAPDEPAAEALGAVPSFPGPVLVDLDETLYLRNSTEDFIDGARPRLLARLVLRLLDILQPWRLTGGAPTRDVWRVLLVGALFPWVWVSWPRRVAALADKHTNAPLRAALLARAGAWYVVTDGFKPIAEPLCRAMALGDVTVVACRLTAADRRRGKPVRVAEALGASVVPTSLVLTDSENDRSLLDQARKACLVTWAGAAYRPALGDVYLPGEYISRVKHPGERYILNGILLQDFAFWLLASLGTGVGLLHVPALLCLLGSFWVIYERGYVDNDRAAQLYESDPVLTREFFEAEVATPALQPWVWALAMGAVGLVLLRHPQPIRWFDPALWLAVLATTHGLYAVYNRVDKRSRVWLYLGLQLARAGAFAVVAPVTLVGAMALASHALSRWFPYAVYRTGAREWPRLPGAFVRLVFFLVLGGALVAAAPERAVLFSWTTAAIAGWILFRARRDMGAVWHAIRWLPK